mmetsp:Transcript_565/g.1524  ORF Transcript_565/g.1524 Transcript_565/m.1524 type:complete len:747 (-) Transcript_565:286-2526(-)
MSSITCPLMNEDLASTAATTLQAVTIPPSESYVARTSAGEYFLNTMATKAKDALVKRKTSAFSMSEESDGGCYGALVKMRSKVKSAGVNLCPLVNWMPEIATREYLTRGLLKDFLTGVTVTAILIPQGMAYGMLAHVPPVTGLYTALMPGVGYMMTGTCRHLSVGPFALVSMLSAQAMMAVVPNPAEDPVAATEVSAVIAAIVGITLVLLGFLRCGFIATFLSDSVLSGFCTAASLIIPASQLKYAFQVSVPRGAGFFMTLWNVAHEVCHGRANWCAFTIFLASVVTIMVLQAFNKNPPKRIAHIIQTAPVPAELCVVVLSTLVCSVANLKSLAGVQELGQVPSKLPEIKLPDLMKYDMYVLVPNALVVALMTYITAMSISSVFGKKYGYHVDSNQELIALGAANLLGCTSSCFPAAASLSRSAVVASAGAASPLHNAWVAVMLVFVLMYFSKFLVTLPLAALSAIVVMAFKSLLFGGLAECSQAWHVSFHDFGMWMIAFWSTLACNVTTGIAVSVFADIFCLFYQTTRPSYSVLRRMKGFPNVYRNRDAFESQTVKLESVLIFRCHAPLHFANREVFHTNLWTELSHQMRRKWRQDETCCVVCDFSAMLSIDMSACRMLVQLRKELQDKRTKLVIAHVNEAVYCKMDDMGLFRLAKAGTISDFDVVCFRELHDAVLYAEGALSLPPLPENSDQSNLVLHFGLKVHESDENRTDRRLSRSVSLGPLTRQQSALSMSFDWAEPHDFA